MKYTGIEFSSDIDDDLQPDLSSLDALIVAYAESQGVTLERIDMLWMVENQDTPDVLFEVTITESTEEMHSQGKLQYSQPCCSVQLRCYRNNKSDGAGPHLARLESQLYQRFSIEAAEKLLAAALPAFPLLSLS